MRNLTEGLSYHDMEGHVTPLLGIDEFESQIGEDSDIIVLNFIVDGQEVGKDLVNWLERGYDWIIDADISPGEVLEKKYYVFVEMNRRSSSARRIIEVLDDLNTLTNLDVDSWEISIDGKKYPAKVESIEKNVPLTPVDYKNSRDSDLNEWRQIAGLAIKPNYTTDDDLEEFIRIAGIR